MEDPWMEGLQMLNQQSVQFFDGSYAQSGYRGRTSERLVKNPDRWAGLAFAAAVLFSTAAGALSINHPKSIGSVIGDHTLPANAGTWGSSFEVASY
jgi:hypothetical protein